MKKKNDIKKEVKKINKSKVSMVNKRRKRSDPDLLKEMRSSWKEIRTNLKPLKKAYDKFQMKRKITKQKEEERRLKENEKQRLLEEESIRLQEIEEIRLKKEKKIKEEEERRLKEKEKQKLEAKRIKIEKENKIKQEKIYRERLLKGEEERIKALKRVRESREEERKLKEEGHLKIDDSFIDQQRLKDDEKQRLKEKEQRLKEEEQRLKTEEQRLKAKEQRLKEEKINPENVEEANNRQEKKRLNGSVKWFNVSKGYGFIKREDEGKDVFVHSSAVQNSGLTYLKKDEQLTFEVESSEKGPSAINLQKTSAELSHSHLKVVK